MSLAVFPLTLAQANDLVDRLHRHHKKAQGHRFSLGVRDGSGEPVGACIVGRPVARKTPPYSVCEVVRLVTDGTKNACSILYSSAARAARAMGYERIQTFTLASEPGTSLRAAGWDFDGVSEGAHGWQSRDARRDDQPTETKHRWVKRFPENGG